MAQTGNECDDDEAIRFRGFTARLENDLFANTDRDYTNGVSLTAISRDLPGQIDPRCLPWPVQLHAALIRSLDPDFWHDSGAVARGQNVVVKLGQSMYTPGDPRRTDLIVEDRPYAGLLYVGLSWNRRTLDPRAGVEKLDTREITLGVIGPASLARHAQDLVHELRGIEKFQGWQHQLKDEPALQLAREQKYRDHRGSGTMISGFSGDTIRSFGLRLGNIETSASAGIEGRIGWNLPNDFGTYPIRPGAENRPPAPTANDTADPLAGTRFGAHLFAVLEAKVVAHDFSLDGNLFRDSHGVTRRPLVGQAAIGASVHGRVSGRGMKLAVMRVFRSREFEEQGSRPAFGSIALSMDF
jgi:lipid A 3-O-deacylase